MRVLNVNSLLATTIGGGTAERTKQMSYYLKQAGVDCGIVTIDAGIDNETTQLLAGVEILALPYIASRFYIPMPFTLRLARMFKDADVVHLMGHWTPINVLAYCLARIYKKPYVVCPAGALRIFGRSRLFKRIYNFFIGRAIVLNADRCIAITYDEVSHFLEYGADPAKIEVIPNGIGSNITSPINEEVFRRKHNLVDVPYILFVGRLNTIKGIDLLIDAICSLPTSDLGDYHFLIAGTNEGLLDSLTTKVVDAGLDRRVHFCGFIGGEEKRQAYYFAELLVIPSRQEAMSIVVLEAGILGTPVLITNRCGFDELAALGCGRVCDATTEGLATGLKEFFESDINVQQGEKLREFVLKNFEWSQLVERYISLYRNIMSESDEVLY